NVLTFLDEERKASKLLNLDIMKIDTLNSMPYYDYTFEKELEFNKLGNIFGKSTYTGKTLNKKKGKLYGYSILSCCNKDIRDSFIGLGIYPDKTKLDCIDVFKYVPNYLIRHFVRGDFDGDGCINKTMTKSNKYNYCLSIAGGSRFLSMLKNIIIENTNVSNTKTSHIKGCDVIRWSGREQVSLIYDWMYKDATIYLERKKDLFSKFYKNYKARNGSSLYRGVTWHNDNQKWLSNISHNKKRINLGYYKEEIEAAEAYDRAVIKYNKPRYKCNFGSIQ
ncbi:hypothetical protein LCGC14_2719750, partial [marine sediment metagenome]